MFTVLGTLGSGSGLSYLFNFSIALAFLIELYLAFARQEGIFLYVFVSFVAIYKILFYSTTVHQFEESNGTPLQYSCLENPMDGGPWKAAVHGVAEGWTQLSDFPFTFHFHALGKEMATHSSVLAWRIPGVGEPGGLLSMGSHRAGHD